MSVPAPEQPAEEVITFPGGFILLPPDPNPLPLPELPQDEVPAALPVDVELP
ncbi:hypothetical protein F4556_004069 [Kitasatospora gansuensis]|uniref:Uncharacterized protein n=1 Tax=Kitasatospora gansuensis TaxID=258050 RepID=A0A7W7SDL7_9ACTN|nr:hypothetical protein [Kitasatospora gansuensis]MBB4948534.1 hypothetical protein [Kitasatospora gansuensis]